MKRLLISLMVFALVPALAFGGRHLNTSMPSFVAVTPQMERSIDKSLAWLASHQRADGFFDCRIGNRVGYGYDWHVHGAHVGVTSIVGMAFLANGHVPGVGPYGVMMDKLVAAVVSATQPNGYITLNRSRMYSHAFGTLFLAEVYGMTQNPDVKKTLKTAVERILKDQNDMGGWRYDPGAQDNDLSVVVCLVQALRAANNVGIYVPRSVIDNALKLVRGLVYTKEMAAKARQNIFRRQFVDHSRNEGGFYYQKMGRDGNAERVTFAICAAGVTALHGTGIYEGKELDGGYQFLKRRYLDKRFEDLNAIEGFAANKHGLRKYNAILSPRVQSFQFFYGHYYAVQAFHQKGGRDWRRWFEKIRKDIMNIQYGDGHYNDEVGETYATAMATLILSLPKGYLPIFQR